MAATVVSEAYPQNLVLIERTEIIDLGTGTSFNVSSYSGYESFTIDNFLVVPTVTSQGKSLSGTDQNENHSGSATFSLNKSYNASTGILTVSSNVKVTITWVGSSSANIPLKVYLIR